MHITAAEGDRENTLGEAVLEAGLYLRRSLLPRPSGTGADRARSGSGGTVYIDLMFLSSIRDNAPSVNTNYQFAFFVDTNGTLNIQHHNKSGGPGVNEWMALSGSPTITSNAWIRLTVQQDYANQMFQVAVDEDECARGRGNSTSRRVAFWGPGAFGGI